MKTIFTVYAVLLLSIISLAQVSERNGYSRYECISSKINELADLNIKNKVQIRSPGQKVCQKIRTGDAFYSPFNKSMGYFDNGDRFFVKSELERYFIRNRGNLNDYEIKYYGKNDIEMCWGSEKNIFRISHLYKTGFALILDEDGGQMRTIHASEIKLEPEAQEEVAKCDTPVLVNAGPHEPVFSK